MLRLMIVDDERVIRETIFRLIDWGNLGIEVIGLCKDGIEAYNMILDELPDIVMADIRMPGLTGLELAKKVHELEYPTKFIILTGYEEFEYAREAMKYGIRHYLLKPCREEQIKESILEVKKECLEAKRMKLVENQHTSMMKTICRDAMFHMILEGISFEQEEEWNVLKESYAQYFDFAHQPYIAMYVYFLEQEKMCQILERASFQKTFGSYMYGVYVKNTFILFGGIQDWNEELAQMFAGTGKVQCQKIQYENLTVFLKELTRKVRRYDTIYVIREAKLVPIFNLRNRMRHVKTLCGQLGNPAGLTKEELFEELIQITESTEGADAMRLLAENISMHLSMKNLCSSMETAEFIRNISETESVQKIRNLIRNYLEKIRERMKQQDCGYGPIADQVVQYVREHLSEPNLTLKRIAEEYLYMNVDYVGRQFQKATGKKFSQFLTEERIDFSKRLLMEDSSCKLQYLADQVGWGNNPQYFSQIFKKMEGTTPAKWIQKMQQGEN